MAEKQSVTAHDLIGYDLMSSRQSLEADFPGRCGEKLDELNITGTVNLFYAVN